MKLAIVHDWIIDIGGAERALIELHRLWPDAPIYTLLYNPSTIREHLSNATIIASHLQRLPSAWRYRSQLAPLMPSAIESFDFSSFDTVISSSVIFAKGIIVRPGTHHVSYCYSPTRMLWDRSVEYERSGIFSRIFRHALRSWDASASTRPDQFVAISSTVAQRIAKFYRRPSIVIPPPARGPLIPIHEDPNPRGPLLVVSRLVPHKQLGVLIQAITKLNEKLIVVGDGPLRHTFEHSAGANIAFMGRISDEALSNLYHECAAVIIPNEEDWGLTAVEAMLHGKPVLALRRGGATESVVEGITGEFFDDSIPEAIVDGIRRIREALPKYHPKEIQQHALQYTTEAFQGRMRALIEHSPLC